jgi:hypothetical protein
MEVGELDQAEQKGGLDRRPAVLIFATDGGQLVGAVAAVGTRCAVRFTTVVGADPTRE